MKLTRSKLQIYILLPVHNRREITRKFIKCLKAQTFTTYHLILIDDGSTDGTEEMVKEYFPKTSVIRGRGNWWWAGSLQHGLVWLRHNNIEAEDVVLIINDDVQFDNDFLEKGIGLLAESQNCMLQARLYSLQTNELVQPGKIFDGKTLEFRDAAESEEINCLTTNGLFVRWKDLNHVGDFYPRLLPHYLSDYEFTIRAHSKGLRLISPEELRLRWNTDTSGLRQFDPNLSFWQFTKSYFSNKNTTNPLHWTAFVLLGKYIRHRYLHVLRIWVNALRTILNKARERTLHLIFGSRPSKN